MTARRVYVVDDEEPIRRSLHLMLRTLKFAPRTFADGPELIESLPGLDAGCVLLDLRMPEIDGLEVQRRLIAASAPHSVIVMSGHGDLGVALTAMEQGAIAFIEKPFSRATLEQLLGIAFLRLEDFDEYARHLRSAAADVSELSAEDRDIERHGEPAHRLADVPPGRWPVEHVPRLTLEHHRLASIGGVVEIVDIGAPAHAARAAQVR